MFWIIIRNGALSIKVISHLTTTCRYKSLNCTKIIGLPIKTKNNNKIITLFKIGVYFHCLSIFIHCGDFKFSLLLQLWRQYPSYFLLFVFFRSDYIVCPIEFFIDSLRLILHRFVCMFIMQYPKKTTKYLLENECQS